MLRILLLLFTVFMVQDTNATSIEIIDSNTIKNDTAYVIHKYVELEDVASYLANKSGGWEEYGNGIIALLTVLISSTAAYFIARYQIKKNSRVIQLQVRANSIAAARIKWVNELRPFMADFVLLSAELKRISKLLSKYKDDDGELNLLRIEDEGEKETANRALKKLNLAYEEAFKINASIRLFLNPNEPLHSNFIEKVEGFLLQVLTEFINEENNAVEDEVEISEYQLEILAQEILKDAWEQAKTETGFYKNNSDD